MRKTLLLPKLMFNVLLLVIWQVPAQAFTFSSNNSNKISYDQLLASEYLKKANTFRWINSDSAIFYANKAYYAAQENNQTVIAGNSLEQLGYIYYYLGNYKTSELYFNRAIEIFKMADSLRPVAKCYEWLGNIELSVGLTHQAMAHYVESMELYDSLGMEDKKVNAYLNFGQVYMEQGDYEKALENFELVVELYEDHEVDESMARLYSSIGTAYLRMNKLDQAEEYLSASLQLANSEGSLGNILVALNNLALVDILALRYDKALGIFEEVVELCEKFDDISGLATAYANIGNILTEQNHYDSALVYFNKSRVLAEEINDLQAVELSYYMLTYLYDTLNNPNEAMRYKQLHEQIADSIELIHQSDELALLREKMEFKRLEAEIDLVKKEKKISELTNYWMATISVSIFLVFVVVMFFLYHKRKKERTIFEKDKELVASEFALIKLHEGKLKQELSFKTRQLSTHALNIIQKNEILNQVKRQVSYFEASKGNSKQFKQITDLVNFSLNSKKDWANFDMYFEQINPDFFLKLKTESPKLTNSELRLCSLIKLNYSPKEISTILNLSTNTIKSLRFRISKKLPLAPDQTLDDFIRLI